MDDITKVELNRVWDELKRHDERVVALEEAVKVQQDIILSVSKLADNMERMLKEQEKQGKRLDALESTPADNWNMLKKTIFTALISTTAGALITALIAFIAHLL